MGIQQNLIDAARLYVKEQGSAEGIAPTPVPGVRLVCVDAPTGKMHSTYRPVVCLVLQWAKRLLVGGREQICLAGQSVIVAADIPVLGQIVEATSARPYIALAVELDMTLLRELGGEVEGESTRTVSGLDTLFLQDIDEAILESSARLMRLIGHPQAIPQLLPGLMKELHYWLLAGPHRQQLQLVAASDSRAARVARAIDVLKTEFRGRISTERLAAAAAMSLTSFHKHFKDITSLTPGAYQKHLRLIEARRLMLYEGANANTAAYQVGYESASQFTRDYGRMFGAPPRRDVRSAGRG